MYLYSNGSLIPEDQPAILATDRGLLLGDGLFESLPIYREKIFQAQAHWDRLQQSAHTLQYTLPWPFAQVLQWSHGLMEQNQVADGYLRWTLTRGKRSAADLGLATSATPTFIVEARPAANKPTQCRLCLASTKRSSTSKITPHKTLNYLENLLALEEARQRGYDEALFCVENDWAQEGSRSNLFFLKNTALWTPPLHLALLPGITRGLILQLYRPYGAVVEQPFAWQDLLEADEIFMTNSQWGILPVRQFENQIYPIGSITVQLQHLLQEWMERPETAS